MTSNEQWALVEQAVTHFPAVLIQGPPSVGKTYFATRTPHKRVLVGRGTFVTDLLGQWMPVGGGLRFQPGPAIQAWTQGERLVIDEMTQASGEVVDFLLGLADTTPGLTLPDSSFVTPAPGFRIVATSNDEITKMPEALQSRFVQVQVTQPHPGVREALNHQVYDLGNVIMTMWQNGQAVDIRRAFRFASIYNIPGCEHLYETTLGPQAKDILAAITMKQEGFQIPV